LLNAANCPQAVLGVSPKAWGIICPIEVYLFALHQGKTKHNSAVPLILPTSSIYPSLSVRALGVILDKELSWQPHLQHIKSKLAIQTNVLSRLTASTWSASLLILRLLYTAVMRPAITTSCPTWWAPPSSQFFPKGLRDKLQRVENRCLRTFSGAYKATPVRSLQAEVGIPPLFLQMDGRQAHFSFLQSQG
jgi:hypothetical protein